MELKWKQIETAPKDGTSILLFVEGFAIEGKFTGNEWSYISLPSHGCGCCWGEDDEPTHWMPLPKLPTES